MNQLVTEINGKATTKVISDHFGKIHRDVKRAIRLLECSDEFRARNFAHSSYKSEQGKVIPCMTMTRDGFCFLAMGFTGKEAAQWKEAFINAFNELEKCAAPSGSVMSALNEAVALMEADAAKASLCGKALAQWRTLKTEHLDLITATYSRAQLVLNFKGKSARL